MIIAEIGLNHMGNENYALHLVKSLVKHKKIEGITIQIREKSFYHGNRKKLILRDSVYKKIDNIIKKSKKKFGVALCDHSKIEFFENLNVDFIKVINNDIKNDFLLQKLLSSKFKNFFFSTGLSDKKDVINLVKKIKKYKKKYQIIHTSLSHDIEQANLNSIKYLKKITRLPIAFGLHSEFHEIMVVSLFYKPSSVLFYVKGNRYRVHRDEKHAIKIEYLDKIINLIVKFPKILGKMNKSAPRNILNYK